LMEVLKPKNIKSKEGEEDEEKNKFYINKLVEDNLSHKRSKLIQLEDNSSFVAISDNITLSLHKSSPGHLNLIQPNSLDDNPTQIKLTDKGNILLDGNKILIGDYKKLPVTIGVGKNQWGITKTDLEKVVKLRLLANGIKMESLPKELWKWKHWLSVSVQGVGDIFSLRLELWKMTDFYTQNKSFLGGMIKPAQDEYGAFGKAKSKFQVMEALQKEIDDFLLDYLDSNIDWQEKRMDIKKRAEEIQREYESDEKSSE